MKRAAIYARVSTNGQSVENQLRELESAAERHGWEIVATYIDDGISGAKGRDKRVASDLVRIFASASISTTSLNRTIDSSNVESDRCWRSNDFTQRGEHCGASR